MKEQVSGFYDGLSRWALALVCILSLAGFFAAFNAAQITSEGAGNRILRRAVGLLLDVDGMTPAIEQSLHAAAENATGPTVQAPDYPIAIELPREAALTLSGKELTAALVQASAERVYDDGLGVLASTDPDAQRDISLISAEGAIDKGLGQVTGTAHTFWLVMAVLLGLISLVAVVMFIRATPFVNPLTATGFLILASALPSLAMAVAFRFSLAGAQDETDPFVDGLLEIGKDVMWAPIRNYIAICALGAALMLLQVVMNRLSQRHPRVAAR